jgi:hypothetical protein
MLAMVWGTAALGNTRALRQALGIFPCRGLTGCNDIYDRRLNECVSITCLPSCLPKIAVFFFFPVRELRTTQVRSAADQAAQR